MIHQKEPPTTGRGRPNSYHNSLEDLKSQLNNNPPIEQNSDHQAQSTNASKTVEDIAPSSQSSFYFDAVIPPLKKREPTVAVSLYLKKSLHTRLKRTAMESEISMNRLIGNLVERWLDTVDRH